MHFDVSIHHRDVLKMSRARTDSMLQHTRMRVRISGKSIRSIGMYYTWVGTANVTVSLFAKLRRPLRAP
jgi:hypothetical protein